MLVDGQGYVSKIPKTGYFIVSLQVNYEGVKMGELLDYRTPTFGFGTSLCPRCRHQGYRNYMVPGRLGRYHPICKILDDAEKRETVRDVEKFVIGGINNAEKKAF